MQWNIEFIPKSLRSKCDQYSFYLVCGIAIWSLFDRILIHPSTCKYHKNIQWSLRWRHNGRDGVSNHQPYTCLLNCLFRHITKKTSKLHVTGLCVGNSPVTGEFPAQRASNAKNVSIWWRHHDYIKFHSFCFLIAISSVLRGSMSSISSHSSVLRVRVPLYWPWETSCCSLFCIEHDYRVWR